MTADIFMAALCIFFGGSAVYLLERREFLQNEVAAGRLVIRLGEPMTGPSYRIAACEVFGGICAALALLSLIGLLWNLLHGY